MRRRLGIRSPWDVLGSSEGDRSFAIEGVWRFSGIEGVLRATSGSSSSPAIETEEAFEVDFTGTTTLSFRFLGFLRSVGDEVLRTICWEGTYDSCDSGFASFFCGVVEGRREFGF